MTTRRPIALVVAPLLAALAACGTPTTAAPHAADPHRSDYPNQAALDGYAATVQDLGRRSYPSVYAGVEVDPAADKVIVHRRPDPAFDRAVRERVPGEQLTIQDAPQTEVQLVAWVATVSTDQAYWQARGITINRIETVPGGSCVKVGVSDPGRDQADIVAHYAPMPVCVEAAGPDVPLAPPR